MSVAETVSTFVGLANENEFYSHHYLAEVFKGDIKALKPIAVELDECIRTKLHTDYGISLSKENTVSEAKSILLSNICAEYGVRPNEAKRVRALARISRDIQDALSAERVNIDEF